MTTPEALRDDINHLLHLVDSLKDTIHLLLVVNTKKSHLLTDDYVDYSVSTEYLSESEVTALISGFRETGVLTNVYVGELNFVRDLLQMQFPHPDHKLLIYSTVAAGTWHGRDSLIPAICGAMRVGCCSGDAYSMAVAGNKYYGLRLAERIGESTAGIWLYRPDLGWCNDSHPPAGTRVIVKPVMECASIGIGLDSVQQVDGEFENFLRERARLLTQPLLVQSFVSGYEVEVPVYGAPIPTAPAAMGVCKDGHRRLGDDFLSYDDVLNERYTYYPAKEIFPELANALCASACRVFAELGLYGFARIDYRVRDDGSWAITDINAIPHLTPGSANHLSFATLGLTYPEFLKLLIAAGLKRCVAQ
jgi:D-alanine-D-alanine ligase